MTARLTGDWMYTSKRSEVAHWSSSSMAINRYAVCGVYVEFGTGSQAEYERAESLRKCTNCIKKGAPSGDHTT